MSSWRAQQKQEELISNIIKAVSRSNKKGSKKSVGNGNGKSTDGKGGRDKSESADNPGSKCDLSLLCQTRPPKTAVLPSSKRLFKLRQVCTYCVNLHSQGANRWGGGIKPTAQTVPHPRRFNRHCWQNAKHHGFATHATSRCSMRSSPSALHAM